MRFVTDIVPGAGMLTVLSCGTFACNKFLLLVRRIAMMTLPIMGVNSHTIKIHCVLLFPMDLV
jgi:hypothetical protein